MSSKNKYGKFTKKNYLHIMRWAVWRNCMDFGYQKAPCLIETELGGKALMSFAWRGNHCVIFYDYKEFKKEFGQQSYDLQQAYVGTITAHEMRHYYQYRQMRAKKAREKKKILARWRKNEKHYKRMVDGYSLKEYLMQPLELDASLYEYVFGAEYFDMLLGGLIKDEEHFNAMEKLYKEYSGKKNPELFLEEMRTLLRRKNKETA